MQGRTMQNKWAKYSNKFSNLSSEHKAQTLSGNSLNKFFCTVTFKNVQIFYQISSLSVKPMFMDKASSSRQRAQLPLELHKRIPLCRDISKELSWK